MLIEKALELEKPEEIEGAVVYIGKLMKSFYNTWNRDNIEEEVILKNIKELSRNKLDIDITKVKENNLFESLYKEKPKHQASKRKNYQKGGSNKRRR